MAATLAEVKRTVHLGDVYDVTNHYIQSESHPAFGTKRRRVLEVTGTSFYLSIDSTPWPSRGVRVAWPKAWQVEMDSDRTIRLFGGGAGQKPGDLFLTLVPVEKP